MLVDFSGIVTMHRLNRALILQCCCTEKKKSTRQKMPNYQIIYLFRLDLSISQSSFQFSHSQVML